MRRDTWSLKACYSESINAGSLGNEGRSKKPVSDRETKGKAREVQGGRQVLLVPQNRTLGLSLRTRIYQKGRLLDEEARNSTPVWRGGNGIGFQEKKNEKGAGAVKSPAFCRRGGTLDKKKRGQRRRTLNELKAPDQPGKREKKKSSQ